MRTRTVFIALLAFYAVVSTGYFAFHLLTTTTSPGSGSSPGTSGADLNSLPGAPPFPNGSPALSARQDLLARVQVANSLQYTDFQSFICTERMDRYKGNLDGGHSHQIDTVNAQVSFEDGVENYSSIEQDNRRRSSMSSIPGAWSEGEFGTLLRQSRSLLATQPLASRTTTQLNCQTAVVYSMNVAGPDSPWSLEVSGQSYLVPFRTDVSVSQADGRILEISRTSTALPQAARISEIQWSVMLRPIPIEGKVYVLPTTGLYSVLYQQSNHREWNVIDFTDYHRYTASSVMHF
jgi:hypothetical protein